MNKIEHVVLLMLENRSFDSLLGWLYEKGRPAKNVPELTPGQRDYEGLQGLKLQDYENVDATGTIKVSSIRGAKGLNVPNIAPGETFTQVNTQLFGRDFKENELPKPGEKPTMKGYVRDYTNLLRHHGYKEEAVKRYAEQVMQSYTPDQLPVLNGLAEHYAVCDMWFSSVPSQTNPNRAFAFCGTSMGLVDNGFLEEDPRRVAIEDYVKYKLGDDRFHAKTIFNALADDGKTTWKVFRQSGMLQNNIAKAVDALNKADPAGIIYASPKSKAYLKELSSLELISDYTHRLFPEILKIKDADSHFTKLANLDDFHSAARAGQLPNFTYIQPEWTIGESGTGGGLKSILFHQGDDYHPPGNLDAGENLVKQIYDSLISNRAAWEKTLLIITFDEPIGSFDHYPPPAAIPEPGFKRQYNFNFDRYGGRVPTILVSPLVQKGTVFRSTTSVPFDHTSIIATILKWRGLENKDFGERTKQAPTFDNIVSLSTPRKDEKEVRFLKISHKAGEPVRFYDRFNLKDAMGKYITGFRENAVFPGSFFAEDPTFSEYFPIQGFVSPPGVAPPINSVLPSEFYLQNANNRPVSGEISAGGGTEVRLIATDYGLGSYNVLGAWKDSRDCYYFNDYMEGDNSKKETWIISKADPFTIEMTTRGVLLAGQWRTEAELSGMSAEHQRNHLIFMLAENSNHPVEYFQGFSRDNDNVDLVGKGAVVVFLLRAGIRDDAALKKMTDADQRNALIEANIKQPGMSETQLKGMSNQQLVQKGLEWFNRPVADPFTIEMTTRGVLLAGQWRTEAELSGMSAEDKRNHLIVMLAENSNHPVEYFQGFSRDNDNVDLVGKGAVVVFLLRAGIRDDAALKKMGDVDQRNALIEANIKQTGMSKTQLKGMSNQQLVQKGLEWFNRPALRFGDKVFIQNKYWDGQRLAPDSWFHDYLTTNKGDAYWTVVPILDEIPGPDSITLNNDYYLKHANTGRYVTQVYKQPSEKWYPTLGSIRDRVKLEITVGLERGTTGTPRLVDGMYVNLYSAKEDLGYSGKRCDVLAAFKDRKSLYYEYRDCTQENRTWMISLREGSGFVKSGSRMRLVNEQFGQFMAPKNGYLTTVTGDSTDYDWMLEKA